MSGPPAVATGGPAAERLVPCPLVRHQGQGTDFPELLAQFLPGFTAIGTHIHVAVETGCSDYVWLSRMSGKPVHDRVRLHRQVEGLPRLAAIGGMLDCAGDAWDGVPVADEDDVRVI